MSLSPASNSLLPAPGGLCIAVPTPCFLRTRAPLLVPCSAPPLSGKLQMALGTVPAPTAAPVSPPAPVYAAPPPPLMDLLGGDPAPAPAPAPAFAAFGQPAAAAPAFAAFGQPPPAPAGFGAFGQAAPAFPAAFPGGPAPAAPSPFAANFGNAPGPAAAPAASGFGDFGAFSAAPSPAAAPAGPGALHLLWSL